MARAPSNRRTVLLIVPTFLPTVGGTEVFTRRLVEALPGYGFNSIIITPVGLGSRLPFRESITGDCVVYRLPVLIQPLREFSNFGYLINVIPPLFIFSLLYMIRNSSRIALIHSSNPVCGLIGWSLARLFRLKCMGMTHGVYFANETLRRSFSRFAQAMSWIYRKQDLMFPCAHAAVEELRTLGVMDDRIRRFKYWIDESFFHAERDKALRSRYGIADTDLVCTFVARITEGKGVRVLLNCARQLRDLGKLHFKFFFFGAGDQSLIEELQSAQQELKTILDVRSLNNDELPPYLASSDVCIMPFVDLGEGNPIAIMEATASGCPIIASQAGGMHESLHMDGAEKSCIGISLPEITESTLLAAMLTLDTNPDLLRTYRENCKPYARRFFSNANAAAITQGYEELLEIGPSGKKQSPSK